MKSQGERVNGILSIDPQSSSAPPTVLFTIPMPPHRAHNVNPPLSTLPGNVYNNPRVDGGRAQFGNTYYVSYGTETTRGGENDDQEDAILGYVLNKLEPYINKNVSYNSYEREQEGASICQLGTRGRILTKIQE
ncbi:hypothetical protein M422DRAFT_274750 [Sphaerobolus stellatus SS14]|uniref:Uncharacterized protein n=1 Tax=Sphaerobolus stellatus (strain SS14) TaxID=990650 RepID=A0A0C9U5U9_SPHS4|nr:hypothetical protein M422DRAFT_274750 [Sphaerobolus stellatus SS14]